MSENRRRGRGRGATPPARKVAKTTASSANDAQVPPEVKFPMSQENIPGLVDSYVRDLEGLAAKVQEAQTITSSVVKKKLELFRNIPIDQSLGTVYPIIWPADHSTKPDSFKVQSLFDQAMAAFQEDINSLSNTLSRIPVSATAQDEVPIMPHQLYPGLRVIRDIRQLIQNHDEKVYSITKLLTDKPIKTEKTEKTAPSATEPANETDKASQHIATFEDVKKFYNAEAYIRTLKEKPFSYYFVNYLNGNQENRLQSKLTLCQETRRLYIANLNQTIGRPCGRNYNKFHFLNEFPYWLSSLAAGSLVPLTLNPVVKLHARDVKAKNTNINLANDESDYDEDERHQIEEENRILHNLVMRKTADFSSSFHLENVMVRLGYGYNRLANTFDFNRPVQLALDNEPFPIMYDSSEDEEAPVIKSTATNRHRFRTQELPTESISNVPDWPGSSLSKYHMRLKTNSGGVNVPTTTPAALNDSFIEENWKTHNIKPRMRLMEPRLDIGTRNSPLGFVAQGLAHTGKQIILFAVDTTEFDRRFKYNRLYEQQIPHIKDRRVFAAVINENNYTARITPVSSLQLILGNHPQQVLDDFLWDYYFCKIARGEHQHHLIRKNLKYKSFQDLNCMVWENDLEKYHKFRVKATELQTHIHLRYLKLRPMPYTNRKTLDDLLATNKKHQDYSDDEDAISTSEGDSGIEAPAGPADHELVVSPEPANMDIKTAKDAAKLARTLAERAAKCSGINKIKQHLAVNWNGTRTQIKSKISSRYELLLHEIYLEHIKKYQ